MDYEIFREELAIKYPVYGHALWEPSPGGRYAAVQVGDVGFIREGYFHRLFNILLPADHESHRGGVPPNHEPLMLRTSPPTYSGTLPANHLRSKGISDISDVDGIHALGPDPGLLSFICCGRKGAILSLPLPAQRQDTAARGDFAKCVIKHIDEWFAYTRDCGLGITRREDIVLVTGCHLARSWANIAFQERDERVSFRVRVQRNSDVEWQSTPEGAGGVAFNLGPSGENLPENQCMFLRGFRVTRFSSRLLPWLRGAAGPALIQDGDDPDDDMQLMSLSILGDSDYQDPVHTLLEYITAQAPECDMALVHDDDLLCIDNASLESLKPESMLSYLRKSAPKIWEVQCGEPCDNNSNDPIDCSYASHVDEGASTADRPPQAAVAKVAMLSNYAFDPLPVADRLKPDHDAAFESLMNALHPQATMPVAPMPSAQLPPYLSLSTPSYKHLSATARGPKPPGLRTRHVTYLKKPSGSSSELPEFDGRRDVVNESRDKGRIKAFKLEDDAEGTLVFSGLFSGAIAVLLVLKFQDSFVAVCWLMSLASSLCAALSATLVHQLARAYLHPLLGQDSLLKTSWIQNDVDCLQRVAGGMPRLIYLSLIFFFLGLINAMLKINILATIVLIFIGGLYYIYVSASIPNLRWPYRNRLPNTMSRLIRSPRLDSISPGRVAWPTEIVPDMEPTDVRSRDVPLII